MRQGGFSLIEVLIGLMLSGLLMSMVAMVLGQSITNNEVIRSNVSLSSRMFTLRRILHRDLQNRMIGGGIGVNADGFELVSTNNFLEDGAVAVDVLWDFSGNMIRRSERSEKIEYENSFQLMRGVTSWTLELLDGKNGSWISAAQYKARALSAKSSIKALRLNLVFEDGQRILIVERIPYAFE
ncbi:general secretion pathway protein J [Maridesulfovibrio ferrireducens]|uniref:General secretion pathway protein J n=2 Tax=Maridesulfovibrio ferrireducens TaxID=246191 RepID=A0A1G9CTA9_9BACT|nr:general secretion pathway protein J [Maridesulfovibrio ferrireducens]